ncbi:MAG: DNA polymerase III subunit alpha, partial [Sedimentibacter sp.]
DPLTIPMDDKETMSLFSSTKALGVTPAQINSKVGTFGIPEFGTKFVRGMLLDTMPKAFTDLICISGLSHGTDVWVGNAKDLIDSGIVTLSEAVCTRDDIMIYLIKKGLPPNTAFKIMETVRKGNALKEPKWPEYEVLMREHDVPEWYIGSCRKIKYMFPKAHAAAYVMMAFRIAWFKVHIPQAYYAAYFTIRAKAFDAEFMIYGKEVVKEKMKEIDILGNDATNRDKDMFDDLELVLEMYERGFKFLSIDLYKSHATKFLVEEDGIRPPLSSISGMGGVAAEGIYNAAHGEEQLKSIDDLRKSAKIGNAAIELLKKFGCLKGLPKSDQLSFFDAI